MSSVGRKRLVRNAIAAVSAAALVGAVFAGAGTEANSAPSTPSNSGNLAKALPKTTQHLGKATNQAKPRVVASKLPQGVPTSGRYGFLLALDTNSTLKAFNGAKGSGTAAAKSAAKAQLSRINTAQASVIAALPSGSRVLYKTHSVMAGVAVNIDVSNYARLQAIHGVAQVYPIAPKKVNNSYAVPFIGTDSAWDNTGVIGQNTSIAIIDTGIDFTHKNFGGPGTPAAYDTAKATDDQPANPAYFPTEKIVGGYDFAGDDYDADPTSPTYQPVPDPDTNPLDCNGHGSHVSGTAAGFGVTGAGNTYFGPYNNTTDFASMKIGPGMAPAAQLYAYKVFGCEGSSDVVGEAIDRAGDPNQDGDPSDHVDVINMSLGSDYGSPQDADSVLSNNASVAGITVVVASGNGGDYFDVGGSPGAAPRTIAVANSVDAQSIVDALTVATPASIDGNYAAERSIAYDWANDSDLSGTVAVKLSVGNEDGCDPLSVADAAKVDGKIAFLEWTDNGVRRCGSAGRSGNVKNAGAIGFILADDEETFSAGITGDPDIPGVLVSKSGGDAIRAHLGEAVTISGTIANGFKQTFTGDNDTLNDSSSRGVRNQFGVKPDVTGVGTSVFSTAMGTGTEGISFTGTSMATPEVAGLASLVKSLHPDWTPEEVKADIMNTANHDLYTGQNQTGDRYGPNRVGSGRVDAEQALENEVLAYNADAEGTVSVSFGVIAMTLPLVRTQTVTVSNKGGTAVGYDLSYEELTHINGVQYSVSPQKLVVGPHSQGSFTVTLSIPNPAALNKTLDPTMSDLQAGVPREFLADASGRVVLDPYTGSDIDLRVPVYSAPRPASTMTQPSSVAMSHGALTQTGGITLSGHGVDQGSGSASIFSLVSGFELQAVSGLAPTCSLSVTSGCVHYPDERSADLKYVGVTSNVPQLQKLGESVANYGYAYFSITTQGPWHTAASQQEFDILIDTNGDNEPDYVVFSARYNDQDVFVANLYDLHAKDFVGDPQLINDRFGDTDTALFDSDTMVLPVKIGDLDLSNARIRYGVQTFSNASSDPVDSVSVNNNTGDLQNPLTFNTWKPGVSVTGAFDSSSNLVIFNDQPGTTMTVRKDVAAYAADHALGALMVHFHNKVGSKAQRLALKSAPTVKLAVNKTSVLVHGPVVVTVTVTGDAGFTPTGSITLKQIGKGTVRTGSLVNGKVTFTIYPAPAGTFSFRADYGGDANYIASSSSLVAVTAHN